VESGETLAVMEEDETDNRYVECAVVGNAHYVVSGKFHLLDLSEYQGIRFLSPATFVTLLESKNL